MNRQRIQKAEAEAERFLSRIADLMDKAKEVGDFSAIECGSPESGPRGGLVPRLDATGAPIIKVKK